MNKLDGIQITIPHNLTLWSVKTIERKTARGNEYGFIEGADGKVMWNDDGTLLTKERAEEIVQEHNRWLEAQKTVTLRALECERNIAICKAQREEHERILESIMLRHEESVRLLVTLKTEQERLQDELLNLEGKEHGY